MADYNEVRVSATDGEKHEGWLSNVPVFAGRSAFETRWRHVYAEGEFHGQADDAALNKSGE